MNINRTNNQPNFRASVKAGDNVYSQLIEKNVFQSLHQCGGDNITHTIFHLTGGKHKGQYHFNSEDLSTGSKIKGIYIPTLDDIIEFAQKNAKAVGVLNIHQSGKSRSPFNPNMSADEIIALGEKLDKKV